MSTKSVVFRPGFRTITPYLPPPAPEFVDFLKRAFGAQEIVRYDSPEGEVEHTKIRIGESAVVAGEAHDQGNRCRQ